MSDKRNKRHDLEIEGFYRDPTTGRYFRKGGSVQPVEKKSPIPDNNIFRVASIPKHIPHLLISRENGSKTDFYSSFLKLKAKPLQLINDKQVANHNSWIYNVRYLKGSKDSLLVLWEVTHENGTVHVIREVPHHLTNLGGARNSVKFPVHSGVTDFCHGFSRPKCFMYIGNDAKTCRGSVVICPHYLDEYDDEHWIRSYNIHSAVWCCCSNVFTRHFAVGGEGGIYVENVERRVCFRHMAGNVHSVEYNLKGSVLYSGFHTGKVVITDLRSRETVEIEKQLYDTGVDEIVLLSDQNYLICGAFNGALCKLDLRMMKAVTEFYGHVHTPRKIPFSISEPLSLLCATGSDNVTRLWSLDGGNPLKSIRPPQPDVPHRSWLIGNSWSSSLYAIQQGTMYHCDI